MRSSAKKPTNTSAVYGCPKNCKIILGKHCGDEVMGETKETPVFRAKRSKKRWVSYGPATLNPECEKQSSKRIGPRVCANAKCSTQDMTANAASGKKEPEKKKNKLLWLEPFLGFF